MPARKRGTLSQGGRLLVLLVAIGVSGCAFGPRALERTHGPYNESVEQVYEEQLLMNLVRLRYNDSPTRLDITSIAAQYELSGTAQAQPFFTAQAAMMSDVIRSFIAVLPAAQVLGANRPTVSLSPADDMQTVTRFLTPLKPEALTFIAQAGWPISTVFRIYLSALNGVPNAPEAGGPTRDVVPEFAQFLRVAELLQLVQDQHDVRVVPEDDATRVTKPIKIKDGTSINLVEAAKEGYEYRQVPDKSDDPKVELYKKSRKLVVQVSPDAWCKPEVQELVDLLHLIPKLPQYELTVEPEKMYDRQHPIQETHLRMVPRSTAQALFFLAHGIIVPPEHLEKGIAKATVGPDGAVFDWPEVTRGLFTVHSVKQLCRPAHALIAVKYHGYWFYIDERDQETKTTFTLMMQLVRLDISGKSDGKPVLTLPVGR
jgi:hypothetical protein